MKKKLLILVPAVFAVAVGVVGLMQTSSGTPNVEAAGSMSATPLTQTYAPLSTGIVLSLTATTNGAVSAAHFNFSYDGTILTATAAGCGTSTGNITLTDISVSGIVDIGCGALPVLANIYPTGPGTVVATATFSSDGPLGVSTQTTVAWQLTDIADACIIGEGDSICTDVGTQPLGTITIAAATATNTPVPTNTPTPVPALGIQKDPASANIWLCKTGLLCTGTGGFGAIKLAEQLFNGSGVGLGAYELQVKYDHKVFDIIIGDGDGTCLQPPLSLQLCPNPLDFTPPVNEPSTAGGPWHSFLGSTSRGVSCGSVITENYTTFGCVSLAAGVDGNGNPTPLGPHGDSGPANTGRCSDPPLAATPVSALGSINPAVAPFLTPAAVGTLFANFNCPPLATVSVSPDSDMFFRIRPTSMNGVVRTLLDENCEAADILGNPLPGSVQGGLTPTCGDSTITVRMLEGDINLDCTVGILDAGIMAFKYGAFFGSLLYDPFFDLEPKLTDFDIDIKDIQFVTGRFGSTCVFAIPPQPPAAPIP